MSISLEKVAVKYLTTKKLSSGTCKAYRATVTKWIAWRNGVDEVARVSRTRQHLRLADSKFELSW